MYSQSILFRSLVQHKRTRLLTTVKDSNLSSWKVTLQFRSWTRDYRYLDTRCRAELYYESWIWFRKYFVEKEKSVVTFPKRNVFTHCFVRGKTFKVFVLIGDWDLDKYVVFNNYVSQVERIFFSFLFFCTGRIQWNLFIHPIFKYKNV